MWWLLMCVEKRLMVLSLVPEPTRRIIQRLKDYPVFKVFFQTFERSLFHDPLDTLALKGLSSATHAQPEHEEKLQKRAYPATTLKSARTVIPTNFYADEQTRGEPQIEKWKMNYDARVWVRPRTTTRVELIRGYTGTSSYHRQHHSKLITPGRIPDHSAASNPWRLAQVMHDRPRRRNP